MVDGKRGDRPLVLFNDDPWFDGFGVHHTQFRGQKVDTVMGDPEPSIQGENLVVPADNPVNAFRAKDAKGFIAPHDPGRQVHVGDSGDVVGVQVCQQKDAQMRHRLTVHLHRRLGTGARIHEVERLSSGDRNARLGPTRQWRAGAAQEYPQAVVLGRNHTGKNARGRSFEGKILAVPRAEYVVGGNAHDQYQSDNRDNDDTRCFAHRSPTNLLSR